MEKTILTDDQQLLLAEVLSSPEITSQFYLTGGTALSEYYFQHRLSEDFDFFSESPINQNSILSWVKTTAEKLQVEDVEYRTLNEQLVFFFHFPHSVVKVDFAFYPFPHLGEFKHLKTLRIASTLDIGVNKLQAIQTRQRGRDFFDLYLIITEGKITIDQLIKNYRNKFDLSLSQQEVSKYFSKILDASDQPHFLGKVDWSTVEQFFLDQSSELAQSIFE